MRNFSLLVLAVFSGMAFGQTALKKPNRALNQDHSMCVNSSGVEKCIKLNGQGNAEIGESGDPKDDNLSKSFFVSDNFDGSPLGATVANETAYWFWGKYSGTATYPMFTATPDSSSDALTFYASCAGSDAVNGGASHWNCLAYASDSVFTNGSCVQTVGLASGLSAPTLSWVVISGAQRRLDMTFPDNSSAYACQIMIIDRAVAIETFDSGLSRP